MEITLKSQSDTVSWSGVFKILGYELCIPIWQIIDIPKEIVDNPNHALKIAQDFFKGRESIWSEKLMTSEKEVSNHLEAQRMIDIGCLYDCFGRIVKWYGKETAIQLYEWGDRYFIHDKDKVWLIWSSIFSKIVRNQASRMNLLSREQYETLLAIIKSQFELKTLRVEKLNEEFEVLCQKFSDNPEEKNLLNNVSVSDITIFNNFDDVNEELDNIFGFELILDNDFAFKAWQSINEIFEMKVRENICEWGIKEAGIIGWSLEPTLKDSFLKVKKS